MTGTRIDCDIHPAVGGTRTTLLPYLDDHWKEQVVSRAIDGLAAGLDGFAGRSTLGLHFECLARHLPEVLGHALDCATTPRFVAGELADLHRRHVGQRHEPLDVDRVRLLRLRRLELLVRQDHEAVLGKRRPRVQSCQRADHEGARREPW